MSYGIIPSGFARKSEQDILNSIIARQQAFFGGDINLTGLTNPITKFDEAIATELGELWESLEEVYNAIWPMKATGKLSDLQINLRGGSRRQATAGSGYVTFEKATTNSVTITSGTLVDNNLTGSSLIQYAADETQILPSVLAFERGVGLTDYLSSQPECNLFLEAQGLAWVSLSPSGSSPYVSGVDYVAYVAGDDKIVWITGHGPAAKTTYYVQFVGYSAQIYCTCTVTGSAGSVLSRALSHLSSPITGISGVFNVDAISGLDEESDLAVDARALLMPFPQVGSASVAGYINNLPGVRSVKIFDYLGWFDAVVAGIQIPMSNSTYTSILNSILSYKMVGAAPCYVLRLKKGAAGGTDLFPTDTVYTGIYEIGVVSDHEDLSNPYKEVSDYVAYSPHSDLIDWSPGGVEPTTGNYYYVQLFPAFTVAYNVKLWIYGTVTLKSGYTLDDVSIDVLKAEEVYVNSLAINQNVMRENVSSIVVDNQGIASLDDFRINVIMRIKRGSGSYDVAPVYVGKNFNLILTDPYFINSEEDGSGTAYTPGGPPAIVGHELRIPWAGGTVPDEGDYYYIRGSVDADILIGMGEIAILEGVNLALP